MKTPNIVGLHSGTAACARVVALLSLLPAAHGQTTDTWSLGSSGLWNVAGNWSGDVVPNGAFNVDIVDGVSTVTLNISAGIDDLTLAKGNTLSIDDNETLTVSGPTISNKGAIQLNGGNGGNGYLVLNGNTTLSGGGTLTLSTILSNGGNAFIEENGSNLTLTNTGNTIQGNGIIGNGGLAVVNGTAGKIDANVTGDALTLNGSGGVTNTGLLEATNGGNLAFGTVALTNTGGNITASGVGSVVSLYNTSVTGGTLNTNTGGAIESSGTTTLNGVTISTGSTYTASNNATTDVSGTITNNGAIQLNGGNGANGYLNLNANTTLTGGGTLTLSQTISNGGCACIQANSAGLILTNTNDVIQGNGTIGSNGMVVVNSTGGKIDANVSGDALVMNGAGGGITNTGLLEATNGGNLTFGGEAVTNTGGNITANGTGSVVILSNTSVTGGTLNTSGGGAIESSATTTLNGVTISTGSTFTASDNATALVLGTITNDGAIQVNGGSGFNGHLTLSGNTTLTGGGNVTLSTIIPNGGNAFIDSTAGQTLTNSNNVIQGNGVIGNGGLVVVNSTAGVIDANVTGLQLVMNGSGGTTNTGLLEATNGGTLAFGTTTVNNGGGNLTASGTGSVISLFNTGVVGGTLNTSGGGAIESAATTTLDGSTAAGAVTIASGSAFTASNNSTTVLLGTINNAGTINLNGGNGQNGYLSFGNASALAATLQGAGTVNLGTTASNGSAAFIQQNVGGVTLTNVNNTIQGEGVIGNGGLTFVNETAGIVDANSTGAPLTSTLVLNGSGGVTNTGTLEATNSGTLEINTAVNNAGGTIKANGANAVVYIPNGSITGGTLTTLAGGTIESSNTTTLSGVTISRNSVYTASNNATTVLNGIITNDGLIQLFGGNGANGYLAPNSNTTLTGAGTVTLSQINSGGGCACIEQNTGGVTLTNTNDVIQGNGTIGNGGLTVVNSTAGKIDANVAGLALAMNGGGGITNTGLIEATNGGTLAFGSTAVVNTKGNITASGAGSVVSLFNTSVTGGTLNTNGGGAIESAATTTLSGLTIATGSTFTASNNATTDLIGTIVNDGAIQLNGGGGANGYINLLTSTTLTGGGTVTLSQNNSNGGCACIQQNTGGLILTNTNNTIEGNGTIGNGGLTVVNGAAGTIYANGPSGTALVLNGGGGLTNSGTLAVSSGDLLHVTSGPFTNFSGTTLTGGTYNVSGTLEIDELGSAGGEIVTDAANIILNGSSASFIDGGGHNALSNLATIAASSSLGLSGGANFTTAGNFTNNGTLSVGSGSTFTVAGSLTNFSGTTLSGGSYDVTGTLAFPGANIVTDTANIMLGSPTAEIENSTTSGNGLANLAAISAASSFSLAGGANFTTAGGFTNSGTLSVGSGSTFAVAPSGSLSNFSGTTLTGGTYDVTGTLQFAGANIVTDTANITLGSPTAEIENSTTSGNGLANLATISAASSFNLAGGANFTTVGNFSDKGTLSVGAGSTFAVAPTFKLTNFSTGTDTLTGGTYDVTGLLKFAGANIVTNAAKIMLTGAAAEIENSTTTGNGLANFATNAATGSLTLAGAANLTTPGGVSNAGKVTIGSGSTFTAGGAGVYTQTAGTTTDGGTLAASGGVTLSGGSLFGAGAVTGNLQSSGIVTPGASATKAGILTDTGTYTQNAAGSLDIGIAGATAGTKYDVLTATSAALGGTLNISQINGYVPTVGSTFKILTTTGTESGTFATVNGLTINGSEAYTVTYQPTDVLLTVVSTPAPASLAARISDTRLNGSADARLASALRDFNTAYAPGGRPLSAVNALWAPRVSEHRRTMDLIRDHR